jgi:hypothetical protein
MNDSNASCSSIDREDDGDTAWVTAVEDALLEKCEGINILHIGVDRASTEGIVFIKCASCADAGKFYLLTTNSSLSDAKEKVTPNLVVIVPSSKRGRNRR